MIQLGAGFLVLVHGAEDRTVTVGQSRDYAARARAAGAEVELVEPPGAIHRAHVDPRTAAWAAIFKANAVLPMAGRAPTTMNAFG